MFDCYEIALLPSAARGYIVPSRLVRDHDGFEPVEIDRGFGDPFKIRGYSRRLSYSQAKHLLQFACSDPWSNSGIFRLVTRASGWASDHERLIEEAAHLLASGQYVLIQVVEDWHAWGSPAARQPRQQEQPEPLTKLSRPDTTEPRPQHAHP